MVLFILILAVGGALLGWISFHNRFVRLELICMEAKSGVDLVLQRRHDLIPNLVAVAKGFADHEREVIQQVLEARKRAISATDIESQMGAENALGLALTGMMKRVEAYPDLQSSALFVELQRELINTEDRIAAARRFYNNNVRILNQQLLGLPGRLILVGRAPRPMFSALEELSRPPLAL